MGQELQVLATTPSILSALLLIRPRRRRRRRQESWPDLTFPPRNPLLSCREHLCIRALRLPAVSVPLSISTRFLLGSTDPMLRRRCC
jgi:hypothetical protein